MTSGTVWVENSELWVARAVRVVWHGRPAGKSVKFAIAVPETTDAIVLLASGFRQRTTELVRVRSDGQIVWRAEPLASDDEWIAVHLQEGLVAHTSNSWIVGLDLNTGATLLRTFTK
jgi:hypothetical protein